MSWAANCAVCKDRGYYYPPYVGGDFDGVEVCYKCGGYPHTPEVVQWLNDPFIVSRTKPFPQPKFEAAGPVTGGLRR